MRERVWGQRDGEEREGGEREMGEGKESERDRESVLLIRL